MLGYGLTASVVDPNTLYLGPDPKFRPDLDPDLLSIYLGNKLKENKGISL